MIILQRYASQRNYELEREKKALPGQPATSHPLKGITVCKLYLPYNVNRFVGFLYAKIYIIYIIYIFM